jgi:hypothetical protein
MGQAAVISRGGQGGKNIQRRSERTRGEEHPISNIQRRSERTRGEEHPTSNIQRRSERTRGGHFNPSTALRTCAPLQFSIPRHFGCAQCRQGSGQAALLRVPSGHATLRVNSCARNDKSGYAPLVTPRQRNSRAIWVPD